MNAVDVGEALASPSRRAVLSVPRARRLAAALQETPEASLPDPALSQLRDALMRELGSLVEDLPRTDRLQVDLGRLRVARHHPDRCVTASGPFIPSAGACRRAVGVTAVQRCVRGMSTAPALAVADVLDAGVADLVAPDGHAAWWAQWYAGLSLGGRAVVRAEATTWATQLLTSIDWRVFNRSPVVGGRDDWWQGSGDGRLVLKGRADVRVVVDGGRTALLVMGFGQCPPDWRTELGFPGLVGALVRGACAAPCRVMGLWPASGQVRVLSLEPGVLADVAQAVVTAVGTWVDARIEWARVGGAGAS